MTTAIDFCECCGKILEKDMEIKSSGIFDPDRWKRTPHYICVGCIKKYLNKNKEEWFARLAGALMKERSEEICL